MDYINPEQIEKIADNSEKASQNIEPNLEQAEGMKQEINNLEKDIQEIGTSDEAGVEENVGENNAEQKNDVSGGNKAGEGNNVVSGNSGGNSVDVEVSSSGNSEEGEGASLTGEAVNSENNKNSFLVKILRGIFGI